MDAEELRRLLRMFALAVAGIGILAGFGLGRVSQRTARLRGERDSLRQVLDSTRTRSRVMQTQVREMQLAADHYESRTKSAEGALSWLRAHDCER